MRKKNDERDSTDETMEPEGMKNGTATEEGWVGNGWYINYPTRCFLTHVGEVNKMRDPARSDMGRALERACPFLQVDRRSLGLLYPCILLLKML